MGGEGECWKVAEPRGETDAGIGVMEEYGRAHDNPTLRMLHHLVLARPMM